MQKVKTSRETGDFKPPVERDLSWEVVYQAKDKLVRRILQDVPSPKDTFDFILAIERGGLWVGRKLAWEFRIPMLKAHVSFREEENPVLTLPSSLEECCVLVVDDIYDTGKTIEYIEDHLRCRVMHAAFLYTKNLSRAFHKEDYFGDYVEPYVYVNFPWEK